MRWAVAPKAALIAWQLGALWGALLCLGGAQPRLAQAVPPAAAAVAPALTEPRAEVPWVQHRVAPGERIAEIAALYGVTSERILEWNELDKQRPIIRTGHELRIRTALPSQSRVRRSYEVRRGDSWVSLAKRFDISVSRLRDVWNDGQSELRAGERIVVFRKVEPPAPQAAAQAAAVTQAGPVPELVPTGAGAVSVGAPDRGRIAHAVQIPVNDALYTLRKPEHSWGSSHAIELLTLALQRFRAAGYAHEVVIMDMSRQHGGRFRPHRSHQSGRDVDIRLPIARGMPKGTVPHASHQVDWDATWGLMQALLSTEQVRFIFLSRPRQRDLLAAAKRAGVAADQLATLLQFPRKSRTAIIRHSRGHLEHLHVRFACGPLETACREQ